MGGVFTLPTLPTPTTSSHLFCSYCDPFPIHTDALTLFLTSPSLTLLTECEVEDVAHAVTAIGTAGNTATLDVLLTYRLTNGQVGVVPCGWR